MCYYNASWWVGGHKRREKKVDLWGVGVGSWCVVSGGLAGGLGARVGGVGGIGGWLWDGCGRGLVASGVGSDVRGWWFGWW